MKRHKAQYIEADCLPPMLGQVTPTSRFVYKGISWMYSDFICNKKCY